MIKDIFVTIDQSPVLLKRPFLPYHINLPNMRASYRIPLWARFNPQATEWANEPWYNTADFNVSAILIGGRRFAYTINTEPAPGQYTFHSEENATFVCIGFSLDTLWMYERISIIATSQNVYSMYGSKDDDGQPNPPMLTSISDISKKTDALRYAKFSFDSIKLSLLKESKNTMLINLFGGQMIISLRTNANINNEFALGKYIIEKIAYDEEIINFQGIDYRYMLNRKFPIDTRTFNKIDYPYIESKYVDKVKPEAIGICNGVPGICLNGNQIYTDAGVPHTITYYNFQFPSGWEGEPIKIEVKNGDLWSEVYPGLGNPYLEDDRGSNTRYRNPNPNPTIRNSSTGIVQIRYDQVLEGGQFGGAVKEVRMFARWKHSLPFDAFKYLLSLSDNDGILAENFQGEFNNLARTGLYMNESQSLYYWIEQLQANNILGGQLILRNGFLFFKLENPNRAKIIDISATDVINHETLSVELAEDFWYSGWDIIYQKSIAGNEEGHFIDKNDRYPTGTIYNANDGTVALIYNSPKSQTFNDQYLQQRGQIIRDLISTFRHKIKNIQLPMYEKYMNLEFYDVVSYLPKAIDNSESMEWIVYDTKKNLVDESITITLIERIKTDKWNSGNP